MPLVDPNLEILKLAVDQLGELVDEMVFLGGCATGLLVTDPAADPIRITDDVDAIVDVATRASISGCQNGYGNMALVRILARVHLCAAQPIDLA
jgi:hypothetical protein